MIFTKIDPVGIDFLIQKYQVLLHQRLMSLWGLDIEVEGENKLYECYGRCYRNKKANGYVAEVYLGSNEYKDVYWNDTLNAISFFGIGDNETHKVGEKANVHLVFFVNLEKLNLKDKQHNTIVHRADEEVRKQVQLFAEKGSYGFKYTSTDLWLENVLREYSGSMRDDRLKAVDMHPIHCFRLNFEINYNKNIC